MSDVVFVTPNTLGTVREEPIGTLLLATILRRAQVDVSILHFCQFGDLTAFDAFLENAARTIIESGARIVSFYCRCDTYHIILRIAERVKAAAPSVYTVLGGPQADLSAVETVRELHYIDYVCCGEGEKTVYPFFSSLLADTPDHTVPGLVFRDGDTVVQNPRPALIENLDVLPPIDYSLSSFVGGEEGLEDAGFPVDVGRGCPFGCTYCSTKTFWQRKYRLKSPERIAEEIRTAHDRFRYTEFRFEHDMFTMNKERVRETCRLIRQLDFPITWHCSARLDCLSPDLIDEMVDSGLTKLYVGIESGSPRMQKRIQKNLKLDGVVELLNYIQSKNVHITASFIYGFPEETEEDISLTLALMQEIVQIPRVTVQAHLCTFFPGTELTSQYADQLTQTEVFSNITKEVGVAECTDLIRAHPHIFPHFHEYHTELRDTLRFFGSFFEMFRKAPTVYHYLAGKYPREQLFQMYLDFVEANRELLYVRGMHSAELLHEDRYSAKFTDDPHAEHIRELMRFHVFLYDTVTQKKASNDIFGFDFNDYKAKKPLADYGEGVSLLSVSFDENGKYRLQGILLQ